MKKIFTLFVFIVTIIFNAIAQEPKKPEKKVYTTKDHKIYINKDLGAYIWLSTSPAPNSEKVRLRSDSSEKFTNPMYFDTEGWNTVRSPHAVDTVTKRAVHPYRDVIFEVYADGIAPTTRSLFKASHSRIIEGKRFYSPDLSISLDANDEFSGVNTLQYSLNGSSYTEYKGELKSFHEGENTLKFYATDNVGNMGKLKDETFYIDTTPPVTKYEIEGMAKNKYVAPDAKIKLTSEDKLSGVRAIYYKINNGEYARYYTPIPMTSIGNKSGTLTFYAEDNLGNKEKAQTIGGQEGASDNMEQGKHIVFEFYVDDKPPVINVKIEGDSLKGKYTYVSERTKFDVTATDDKSGVHQIFYSWNSKNISNEYKQPIQLTSGGLHYLRVKAVDYVGNISPVLTKVVLCDANPPVTKLTVNGPTFSSRDTLFISSSTRIKLTADDDHSGTANIYYAEDNESPKTYEKELMLSKAGFHTISYFSTDRVGNKGKPKVLKVFVDNLPPVIYHHFSVDPIGKKTVRDETFTIYPTNVMLYIASTDANSGSKHLVYTINGGPTLTENPIKGLAAGNYEIEVRTSDVLGNESSEKIKFAIEK